MTPRVLAALVAAAVAAAALGGVWVERARSRREMARLQAKAERARAAAQRSWDQAARWHGAFQRADELRGLAEPDLAEAVRGNAELRDGVGRVWDAGFAAGQRVDQARLVIAEIERRQREPGTWS